MPYICIELNLMNTLLFLVSLLVLPNNLANSAGKHDFHISKTKIKYHESSQSWQISTHIFIDDLQEAILLKGVDISSIFDAQEAEYVDEAIYYYLLDNLLIEQNGRSLEFEWIGKELSEDLFAVWIYLEVPSSALYGDLRIDNNILVELFDDQSNITVLELPGRKKEYLTFYGSDDFKDIIF